MKNIRNSSYEGEDRRSKRLHLDPTISWGHILTTMLMVGGLIASWMTLDSRVTKNGSQTIHNRELITRLEKDTDRDRAEVKGLIRDMNLKLDRIIQSSINGDR